MTHDELTKAVIKKVQAFTVEQLEASRSRLRGDQWNIKTNIPTPRYKVGTIVTFMSGVKVFQGLIVGASYEKNAQFQQLGSWVYEIKKGRKILTVEQCHIMEIIETNLQDLIKEL